MAGSLAVGLVAALLLAAAPFISPEEDDVTGAVLGGFAFGWATYDGGSYDAATDRVAALGSAAARIGLVRLVGRSFGYGDLPAESRGEARASTATADYAAGWIDEFVQANASGAEAAMLTDLGDKPLVILTAGAGTNPTHDAAQTHRCTAQPTDPMTRLAEPIQLEAVLRRSRRCP